MVLAVDDRQDDGSIPSLELPLWSDDLEDTSRIAAWRRGQEPGTGAATAFAEQLARFRRLLVTANQVEDIADALLTVLAEVWSPRMALLLFLPREPVAWANRLFLYRDGAVQAQELWPEVLARLETLRQKGTAYWQAVLSLVPQVCQRAGVPVEEPILMPWRVGQTLWGALAVIPSRPPSALEETLWSLLLDQSAWALRWLLAQEDRASLQARLEKAQEERDHLWQQLLQAEHLAAVGELVSGVAHDLNNPLTSVMGFAQLLQLSDLTPEQKADLTVIDTEAQRCRQIVRNLLGLVHEESTGAETVSLAEVVRRILELMDYGLRNANIQVVLELPADLPPVRGDARRIQQALLQLIRGAQRRMAATAGVGTLTISGEVISSAGARPMVRLGIADTAPKLANAPEGWGAASALRTLGHMGALALAAAHEVLALTHGQLALDATYSMGNRFWVVLPLAASASVNAPAPAPERTPQGTILFVDDELDLASLAQRVLSRAGYDVFCALSGGEALQRLAERRYDLIILDLKMPDMSGRDVYELIRRAHPEMAGRIVFTTGDTVNQDTRAWLAAVGGPVLTKPYTLDQLTQLVDEALQGKL